MAPLRCNSKGENKKDYRIKEIDEDLRRSRTRNEAKLFNEAKKCGVLTPLLFDINLKKASIKMENIIGKPLNDIIEDLDPDERRKVCKIIGEDIAKLHEHGIIHGDLTTSNIIMKDKSLVFIDFGLGRFSQETEDRGVDLLALKRPSRAPIIIYGGNASKRFSRAMKGNHPLK